MVYRANLTAFAIAGAVLVVSPASAQPGTCVTATQWRAGNNSDEGNQYIGPPGASGMMLLNFYGPVPDTGRPSGYHTFAAPIEGLVVGVKYRLRLVFERKSTGVEREVSLSVAGMRPQSRIIFRHPGRQMFFRDYIAEASQAFIMIHMKGFGSMFSLAGLPQLCRY